MEKATPKNNLPIGKQLTVKLNELPTLGKNTLAFLPSSTGKEFFPIKEVGRKNSKGMVGVKLLNGSEMPLRSGHEILVIHLPMAQNEGQVEAKATEAAA